MVWCDVFCDVIGCDVEKDEIAFSVLIQRQQKKWSAEDEEKGRWGVMNNGVDKHSAR